MALTLSDGSDSAPKEVSDDSSCFDTALLAKRFDELEAEDVRASMAGDTENICNQIEQHGYAVSVSTADSTSPQSSHSLASEPSTQTNEMQSPPRLTSTTVVPTQRKDGEEQHMDPFDLELVACFANMVGLPEIKADASRLIFRSLCFLRSCGYHIDDICVVFAHASIYFQCIQERCGKMSDTEAVNIILVLMYMAHAHVQDRHCPLRIWHDNLFRNYCTLHMLNQILIGIMKMRAYVLRVNEDEMNERCARLFACVQHAS